MRSATFATPLAVAGALAVPATAPAATVRAPLPGGGDAAAPLVRVAKARLVHHNVRLRHKLADARGTHVRKRYASVVRRWSVDQLQRHSRKLRRALREERREARRGRAVSPALQAIAACESGGNPRAIGGGGAFRGKYQFTVSTWAAVGGEGDPAKAPEAEQDRRAARLYAAAGAGQWPVCGR